MICSSLDGTVTRWEFDGSALRQSSVRCPVKTASQAQFYQTQSCLMISTPSGALWGYSCDFSTAEPSRVLFHVPENEKRPAPSILDSSGDFLFSLHDNDLLIWKFSPEEPSKCPDEPHASSNPQPRSSKRPKRRSNDPKKPRRKAEEEDDSQVDFAVRGPISAHTHSSPWNRTLGRRPTPRLWLWSASPSLRWVLDSRTASQYQSREGRAYFTSGSGSAKVELEA